MTDIVEETLNQDLVEDSIESQSHTKLSRAEMVSRLRARDGDACMYPSCHESLNFDITEGPMAITVDHWIPQSYGKSNGWTWDQIWDLDNLKLMHKKCNAKKGDRLPNADGTLPDRKISNFKFRRQKRANRPDLCMECDNGHNLFAGEVCAACNCDAQHFPREAKKKYPDCDHELYWCWVCSITPEMRPSAVGIAMRQGESGEWGDQLT